MIQNLYSHTYAALGIIYSVNELYFATVSKKTVDVFSKVVNIKRKNEIDTRESQTAEDNSALEKLFDVLFEEP